MELGFFMWVFVFVLLKKSELIFTSPVSTLHSAHRKLTPRALYALTCNANIHVHSRSRNASKHIS